MVPKLARFGKWIRNNWKILKCGGGKGWTRSVRPIMSKMKYYKESRKRRIKYKQQQGS